MRPPALVVARCAVRLFCARRRACLEPDYRERSAPWPALVSIPVLVLAPAPHPDCSDRTDRRSGATPFVGALPIARTSCALRVLPTRCSTDRALVLTTWS